MKEENKFVGKIDDIEFIDDKENIRYLLNRAFPELKEKYDPKIDPLIAAQKRLKEEK